MIANLIAAALAPTTPSTVSVGYLVIAGGAGGSARGAGGAGLSNDITGTSVARAGGGGGGGNTTGGTATAGGGNGGSADVGSNGTANTGGGGGGGVGTTAAQIGGSGGSGVVILRYPSAHTITLGGGLTGSTATVGANKVTTITAGTGNVSWAA